jgi:hypothetical protein
VGNSIEVPSMGLRASLTGLSCDKFNAAGVALPASSAAYFINCTPGFFGIIAPAGGALQPLATAPAGTVVLIHAPSGVEVARTLDGTSNTFNKNPDGSWPGHGTPPGTPVIIEIRGTTSETERIGFS